ncbi:hypothetical protein [Caudoviricetes sp.]|nr:hypothetical protein [Caudoviricetes sp.]
MTDKEHRLSELLALIGSLHEATNSTIRTELFNLIRSWWNEIGPEDSIRELTCSRLGISAPAFNMFLLNPDLCLGLEIGHKNIRAGWLRDYLDYTANNEAPEDFHIWVGITIVGAAIRRKAWHDGGHFKVYPNLYTVLVAPPGVGKKTTAIRIGLDLLQQALPNMHIISEKITPEALAKTLARPKEVMKASGGIRVEKRSEGIIVAPELTVFLGREQYNEGLVIFLTRLYDGDSVSTETISRSVEKLDNVWLALLGATTPTEINKAIPSSASGGGLMSRLNIIHRESTPRSFPFPPPIDRTLRDLLITKLAAIDEKISGVFHFSTGGHEWYEGFYRKWKEKIESQPAAVVNLERQADHVIKVAMVLAASETLSLELTEDILQRAHNILQAAQSNTLPLAKMIDTTDRGKNLEWIVQLIRRHGGMMDHTTLLKKCYNKVGKAREVHDIMDTLQQAGILTKWQDDKKRPITYWYKLTRLDE